MNTILPQKASATLYHRQPQLDRFGIYNYCSGRVDLSYEVGFLVISVQMEAEDATKESFARYVREELEDDDLDPEEFLDFEQRLPVQRCREMFYNMRLAAYRRFTHETTQDFTIGYVFTSSEHKLFWELRKQNSIAKSCRFPWPSATPTSPIPPGLFQSSYGPHGIELIRLEVPLDNSIRGMKGVKVTGDPNVPFDKVTFEIDTPGCLNIPTEEQRSCRSLEKFLEDPQYLDFQVVHSS